MPSGFKGQALKAMVNERAKELRKAVYEPGTRDYLVAVGKSWMILTVRNSQYIWSHRWRDTQTLNICELVDVMEKLRFVRSGQFFKVSGSWCAIE